MKLYYSPGACSLAAHIALREAGVKFDLEKVDLKTRTLAGGGDYRDVAPKGQVPLLELDDGQRLSENAAVLQHIADHAPGCGLAPAAGTMERYRLMEWLNFIAAEVHKSFTPLFDGRMPQEAREIFVARLNGRFAFIDRSLEGRDYLLGGFTVADAYLFAVSNWAGGKGVDLSSLAQLTAWRDRVRARPAVQTALQAEGLDK
jgi:glutathione S-transferase